MTLEWVPYELAGVAIFWGGIAILFFIFWGLKYGFGRATAATVAAIVVLVIGILIVSAILMPIIKPIHDALSSIFWVLGAVFSLVIVIVLFMAVALTWKIVIEYEK